MLNLINEALFDMWVNIHRTTIVLSCIGSISDSVKTLTVPTMLFFLSRKFICNCFIVLKYQAVLMIVFLSPPELSLKLRYLSDLSI